LGRETTTITALITLLKRRKASSEVIIHRKIHIHAEIILVYIPLIHFSDFSQSDQDINEHLLCNMFPWAYMAIRFISDRMKKC